MKNIIISVLILLVMGGCHPTPPKHELFNGFSLGMDMISFLDNLDEAIDGFDVITIDKRRLLKNVVADSDNNFEAYFAYNSLVHFWCTNEFICAVCNINTDGLNPSESRIKILSILYDKIGISDNNGEFTEKDDTIIFNNDILYVYSNKDVIIFGYSDNMYYTYND